MRIFISNLMKQILTIYDNSTFFLSLSKKIKIKIKKNKIDFINFHFVFFLFQHYSLHPHSDSSYSKPYSSTFHPDLLHSHPDFPHLLPIFHNPPIPYISTPIICLFVCLFVCLIHFINVAVINYKIQNIQWLSIRGKSFIHC